MKKVILGICGGIAAYKAVLLVRLMQQQGFEVQPVLTAAASHFVSPHTLQALCQRRIRSDLFDEQAELAMSHIELARWADAIVIAPLTAHTLARLAHGQADDLLTTLCLASKAPIYLAPAMNQNMWQHPATQNNIAQLKRYENYHILPVACGYQACGEYGAGRMLEPEEILQHLKTSFSQYDILSGLSILITAGPTQEAIDPVRYLSNRSSGKMGYALAAQAAAMGASVTLISGPTALETPPACTRINVGTALEMHQAVLAEIDKHKLFISVAAVADYRVEQPAKEKIKKEKNSDTLQLKLVRNPDILSEVAALPANRRPFVVGFAAETENLIAHAKDKLRRKNLDLIVANRVGDKLAFAQDDNQVSLLFPDKQSVVQHDLPKTNKQELAQAILTFIADLYQKKEDYEHTDENS